MMSNQIIKGWTYQVFPADVDAAEFGSFRSLIDMWNTKRGSAEYPTWRDFAFEEFSEWWGRLSLATILDDPFDLEFPLWGTTLTNWWGMDYTRKKMSTAYPGRPENWEKFEGPYFRSLIEFGGIGLVSGDLRAANRGFISVQGIDLLLMKDGAVRQVLSGYRSLQQDQLSVPTSEPLWRI